MNLKRIDNSGFTLIEVLAVIIVLAAITLITYPLFNNIINDNKENLYNKQITELKRHADTWTINNSNSVELQKTDQFKYLLTFQRLYDDGFLSSPTVTDPRSGESMPGCLLLTWHERISNYTIDYISVCQIP